MNRRLLLGAALTLGMGLPSGSVDAQLAQLTPNAGEIGIEMRALRAMRSRVAERTSAHESFVSTWVNVPLSGMVLSPRFLTYHAAFRPTRSEQSMRGGDGTYRLNTIGVNGGANLFSAAPVSLTLHADRTTASAPREMYGANSGYRNGSHGGLVRLRFPAFPTRFEWNSLDRADEWQSAPTDAPIRRDESLDVLRLTAESSKLTAALESQRFVDRVGTLDFRAAVATLSHRLRWGTGSSITSSLESHAREGRDAQRRGLVAEHLHLQHAPKVSSDLTLHRQRTRSEGDRFADIATAILAVNAELGAGAVGAFTASRIANGFDAGRLRTHSVAPSLTWRRAFGSEARLLASAGMNLQRTDQRLIVGQPTPISDEGYVVSDTRTVLLSRARVEPTSIQVFSRDRTVIYLADVDYRVRTLGDELRLEIPLLSRIAPGDVILVSYLFVAPTARLHDLATTSLGLSFARRGVTLSQTSQLRRARLLVGDDDGLEGGDDHVTALEWRGSQALGSASVGAQHRSRTGARANFTVTELRSMLSRTLGADRSAHLAATYARTRAGAQRATVWTTQATVAWALSELAHVGAGAESQLWTLDGQGTDRTTVLTADLRWRGGRMESELRYAWQQRTTLEQRAQHRLVARLLRRF